MDQVANEFKERNQDENAEDIKKVEIRLRLFQRIILIKRAYKLAPDVKRWNKRGSSLARSRFIISTIFPEKTDPAINKRARTRK
jgi:hypothetical protein